MRASSSAVPLRSLHPRPVYSRAPLLPHVPVLRISRPSSSLPFRPPPISQRLKPLVPFFIYWTVITSLAVHLLQTRTRAREEMAKKDAQISVLEGLIARMRSGKADEEGMRREMEMVGLRERTLTTGEAEGLRNTGDVGWREAIFGRRKQTLAEVEGGEGEELSEENERKAVEEWTQVVREAITPASPAPSTTPSADGIRIARRSPSSGVYL